jgi:cytoskeletal protein CcmA (bactofilin family)
MGTSAGAQGSGPVSISTIGEDLTITGSVTSKGELHLNSQVQGDVQCVALVLGENAQLEGSIVAEELMVRGRLIGSVRALRVTPEAKSHVEATSFTRVSPLNGTHFVGESRPSANGRTTPKQRAWWGRETARTRKRLH